MEEYFKAKSSLGNYNDELEYLSARLQCDEADVHLMMKRCSCLSKVSSWKLKFALDYLLGNCLLRFIFLVFFFNNGLSNLGKGILPIQIILTPRVLCHRLEMVKYRISVLEAHNIQISTLSLLCCSDKMFERYLANKVKK